MALVAYSDSDSDSEVEVSVPSHGNASNANKPARPGKTEFQKVVDRVAPNKIKVSLASLTQSKIPSEDASQDDDRPTKRAKTGGSFGGFNSFLPAPKNPSKAANRDTISRANATPNSDGVETKSRISLKTGSEPAFRRDQAAGERDTSDATEDDGASGPAAQQPEVKLVGKNTMFKPLSVTRKQKKRPTPHSSLPSAPKPKSTSDLQSDSLPSPAPKAKKSLFSVADDDLPIVAISEETSRYEPMFQDQQEAQEEVDDVNGEAHDQNAGQNGSMAKGATLEELANSMGLSSSERRQLFGRKGKPTDAQVAQFSLAAEYAHNRELLEKQDAAPQHNPVKAIAPGKHSLQQLINAASNNKDALEESFLRGKNNKKEAGNKYGW